MITLMIIAYIVFKKVIATKTVSKLDPARWDDPTLKQFAVEGLQYMDWLTSQGFETSEIISFDGLKLRALLVTPETPSDTVVITVHGYRSRSLYNFPTAAVFYRSLGMNVLMLDNRGHGDSEGKFKTFGVLDRHDVRRWVDYAVTKFGKNCKIFLHGMSMGGATVLLTTAMDLPDNVKGVIDDCGFTSGWNQIEYNMRHDYHVPPKVFLPLVNTWCRWLGKFNLKEVDTLTAMRGNKIPVMFIHGAKDYFVPVSMTEENYAACVAPKEIHIFENGIHARSYASDRSRYESLVESFVKRHENDV